MGRCSWWLHLTYPPLSPKRNTDCRATKYEVDGSQLLKAYDALAHSLHISEEKGGIAMELKNAKIGVLVNDPSLRRTLSDLLWKNGAVVYQTSHE